MSRTPRTRRPVRAVLALTVGVASLVGLGHASAAPGTAVTYAVTGVSPAYVEAGVDDAFGITLTGKGFTRKTEVRFSRCDADVATVAPSTVTATKLVVKPPKCPAGVQDITVTEGTAGGTAVGTAVATSTLPGKLTFLETPRIAVPAEGRAITPAAGPWSGGTAAFLDVVDLPAKAVVQVLFTTDGVTKAVPGKVDAKNARRITFKAPAGVPGVSPDVAVSVFGVLSDPVEGHFEHVSTIKTSPAVWVKGATVAPPVKIDGAGFTSAATVRICGQRATLVAGKATAKSLVVTPPPWDVALAPEHRATGGVCTVEVTVGAVTSVVTAGSTFTYAAY